MKEHTPIKVVYHCRNPKTDRPFCGAACDGYDILMGFWLGLVSVGRYYDEGVVICEDCMNHDDVALALLGEL